MTFEFFLNLPPVTDLLRGIGYAVIGVGFWVVGFVIYYIYLRRNKSDDDEPPS